MNTKAFRPLEHPVTRLALTAAIVLGVIYAPIPFPFKVPTFAIIALAAVRYETGSLTAIGLAWPASWPKTFGWALLGTALCIFGIGDIVSPALEWLLGVQPDYSGYGALQGNLPAALRLIGLAMFSAAIAEEVVYRGFLLHNLTALFGESKLAKIAAIMTGAALFAIPHASQGPVGATMVFLTGALAGWIFLASNRNLFAVMMMHAMIDIWGVTNLYLGN